MCFFQRREQPRPVFIASSFCLIMGVISARMPLTSFLFFFLAARKMFPKRKLNESGSGGDDDESPKDEAEAKEEQGQQNKRPRVEAGAGTPGNNNNK